MVDFERIPLWAMAWTMLVLTVLAAGGMSALMRTRTLRLWVLAWIPAAGLVFTALGAALKRDSLSHAMLLYDDVMILLASIVLAVVPAEIRLRREAARNGTAPAEVSKKTGTVAAWTGIVVLVVVTGAEYLVAYHHQL